MHVIVLSCTHLQKNMYVSMQFLYLVLTFDPTGKGSIDPIMVMCISNTPYSIECMVLHTDFRADHFCHFTEGRPHHSSDSVTSTPSQGQDTWLACPVAAVQVCL